MVFLDQRKEYDTVDRERLLITQEGYRAGPCLCRLLENFWYRHHVVPRQSGFHGTAFPTTRGVMQGVLVPTNDFNVVADNIIRTWLAMTVEDQRVDHDGLGETVGRCLLCR